MFRVGQKFLAFGGRTVENARYRDLNSDIPVCLSTEPSKTSRVIDKTGQCGHRSRDRRSE